MTNFAADIQTIVGVIDFAKQYGPALMEIGGVAKHAVEDLILLAGQYRNHESLTGEQSADLHLILTTDPASWGVSSPAPAPPPATNDKGFPIAGYNTPLTTYPDATMLDDGDIVYELPGGRYYVAAHGFGVPGIPGEGWKQIWPGI